jgi:hypothetical protein
VDGELTFGGLDSSKFTGDIVYAPFSSVNQPPFSYLWSLDVAEVWIGSTLIQSASAGALVDSGTTWLTLPYNLHTAFLTATGGYQGPVGLIAWPTAPTETFTFSIAGSNITLTPEQYLIPAEQLDNWSEPTFYLC